MNDQQNAPKVMLEVKCWHCQQTLIRFHNVLGQMKHWYKVTGMLPLPLPPGCYECSFQHLGIILTNEDEPAHYPKDYEGFMINDILPPKED